MSTYKQSFQETRDFLIALSIICAKLACSAELIENQFNPLEAKDSLKIKRHTK